MIALVLLVREKVASASRSILLLPIQKSVYITQELAIPNTLINKSKNPFYARPLARRIPSKMWTRMKTFERQCLCLCWTLFQLFTPEIETCAFIEQGPQETTSQVTAGNHWNIKWHVCKSKLWNRLKWCNVALFLPYGLAKCKSRGFQILEWGSKWFSCNRVRKKICQGPSKLISRSFDHSEKDAFRCIQSSWPGQLPLQGSARCLGGRTASLEGGWTPNSWPHPATALLLREPISTARPPHLNMMVPSRSKKRWVYQFRIERILWPTIAS